jgi:hypothetical protein
MLKYSICACYYLPFLLKILIQDLQDGTKLCFILKDRLLFIVFKEIYLVRQEGGRRIEILQQPIPPPNFLSRMLYSYDSDI